MHDTSETAWEYGGEFHWPSYDATPQGPILPAESRLFGSARDAIRALIALGVRRRGWRRWFVPSYLCEEVVAAIAATGIGIVRYADSPLRAAPPALGERPTKGDVVFLVNYFGLRGIEAAEMPDRGPAELVEDHTHYPWSDWATVSRADFCIASLRKTLPLPDGGVLWSPAAHNLPEVPPLTPERSAASLLKLRAMAIKRLYLQGRPLDKEVFRRWQIDGERQIASAGISGPSKLVEQILPSLPWDDWRRRRQANYTVLAEALSQLPGIEVFAPFTNANACPFSAVLKCDAPQLRDLLREGLIRRDVYPAVLWPLENGRTKATRQAAQLAQRILSIPCDFRYHRHDLLRVLQACGQTVGRRVAA